MIINSDLIKRYLVLCAGLLVMAFGVAFSIRAALRGFDTLEAEKQL